VEYLIQWDFENDRRRFWNGLGFTDRRKSAIVFDTLKKAEREASKVLRWSVNRFGKNTDIGASVRPTQESRRK
jgi:hypothetical protein